MRRVAAVLAIALLSLPAGAQTNFPNLPTPKRPDVVRPNIFPNIIITLPRPTRAPSQPVQQPRPEQAQRTAPKPASRPIYRDIALPKARPLTSLGRPIPFTADAEPRVVSLLITAEDPEVLIGDIAAQYDLDLIESTEIALIGARLYKMLAGPEADLEALVAALIVDGRIEGVQPNYLYQLTGDDGQTPARDMRALQYAPEKLALDQAHELGRGRGVQIGVIDTGIDRAHAVFAKSRIRTFDALTDRPTEALGHGTAMAGLAVAGTGLAGVAPEAELLAARAFETGSAGVPVSTSYALAKAMDWAIGEGADVLNLSFAGPRDPLILKLMDAIAEIGVPVLAAAGNAGPDAPPAYPGAHVHAIAVTATDDRDRLFAGANRGFYVAIAAPGVDVLSPLPGNRYELLSGTSVATAQLSGVVALMLEQSPELTRDEIAEALFATARDLGEPGEDADFGAGLANARRAAEGVRGAR